MKTWRDGVLESGRIRKWEAWTTGDLEKKIGKLENQEIPKILSNEHYVGWSARTLKRVNALQRASALFFSWQTGSDQRSPWPPPLSLGRLSVIACQRSSPPIEPRGKTSDVEHPQQEEQHSKTRRKLRSTKKEGKGTTNRKRNKT